MCSALLSQGTWGGNNSWSTPWNTAFPGTEPQGAKPSSRQADMDLARSKPWDRQHSSSAQELEPSLLTWD